MRRRFLFFLLFVGLIVPASTPARAQSDPASACNKLLDDLTPIIYRNQLDYATLTGGRLFQGLPTHTTPPVTPTPADNLANSPADQFIGWVEFLGSDLPAGDWPCSLTINVYAGPAGQGYEIVAEIGEQVRQRDPAASVPKCDRVIAYGGETAKRKKDNWECGQ